MKLYCTSLLLILGVGDTNAQTFNENKFQELVTKIEGDIVDLAAEVESLYAGRCDDVLLSDCFQGNYNDCLSQFPTETCPGGTNFNIPACGDGSACSGIFDFETSAVTLPGSLANGQDGNPTDPSVIEAICFTRNLDDYFIQKYQDDKSYWQDFGVEPQAMFFGSHNGAFRIFPARQTESCGEFDPRVRPWFVAASSGPKNVIMVLDTSGSMAGIRLELMKQAAQRVISTLAVGDRVAIVKFNSGVNIISDDGFLFTANDENKAILNRKIGSFEAGGSTNFYDAFNAAFDVLDASVAEEFNVNCNTAVLFLTDGQMTDPDNITEDDVIALVQERIARSQQDLQQKILIFTYSVSERGNVGNFPSRLACAVDFGVWSKVTNDDEIIESLSSYYLLFALGLGEGQNDDFVAWVEPYIYSTGGILGTTISVPVYDRTKSPALFLGVVGIDFPLEALNIALGNSRDDNAESIRRVSVASTARCPDLELGLCELESFRRQGADGDDSALCTNNCTEADFVVVEEQKCDGVPDYPRDFWVNTDYVGMSYSDRVCCLVGETGPSDQCLIEGDKYGFSTGAIVGMVALALAALGVLAIRCCKTRSAAPEASRGKPPAEQVRAVEAIPPPLNPNYQSSAPLGRSF